jgi:predicted AAA+ superfamily ATPase
VKSAKEKLLEEINTVEKEKDRLKSLQVDGLESTVLDKVLANSSLSEMNRSQLPSHTRGRAEEVHPCPLPFPTVLSASPL